MNLLKLQLLLNAREKITPSVTKIQRSMDRWKLRTGQVREEWNRMQEKIRPKTLEDRIGRVTKRVDKMKASAAAAKVKLLALFAAAGVLAGSFVGAANTAEGYQVRLTRMLGSAEQGALLFKEMAGFAGTVSFGIEEIMGSATQLGGILEGGVGEIRQWMPIVADLAAFSGLSIEETTGQVVRMLSAGAGAADLFRERGVLAMLGFQAGATVSAEQTRKKLLAAWNDVGSKFRDTSRDLAGTASGLWSMLTDKWFQFRLAVMNSGPFERIKRILRSINDRLDHWFKSDDFEHWVGRFAGGMQKGLEATRGIGTALGDIFELLGVRRTLIGAFIGTLLGKLALFLGGLSSATTIIFGFTVPIVAAVGAVLAALASVSFAILRIYGAWARLGISFGEVMQGIAALIIKYNPFSLVLRMFNWLIEKITGFDLLGMLYKKLATGSGFVGDFVRRFFDVPDETDNENFNTAALARRRSIQNARLSRVEGKGEVRVVVEDKRTQIESVRSDGFFGVTGEVGMGRLMESF